MSSYWGGPATSPAWPPSRRGPSPVVPLLLLVVAQGWVIYNETLMEWYEQVAEVQETVTDNAIVLTLTLAAGFLLLTAVTVSSRSEVVLVPMALVLVLLLMQNTMVAAVLLLLLAYFAGIYCCPADQGGYGGGGVTTGGDWAGSGLGFYMLLLLCLVLCAMFSDEGVSWWIPGVLLAACLLCLNLFSGGKVLGHEYF